MLLSSKLLSSAIFIPMYLRLFKRFSIHTKLLSKTLKVTTMLDAKTGPIGPAM